VEDYVLYDDDLSSAAYDQIEYLARGYDITADAMLEIVRRDMTPQQQSPPAPQTAVPYTDQPPPQEENDKGVFTVGTKTYPILRTEMVDGKEIVTIDMDGVEVTIGDEVEDTTDPEEAKIFVLDDFLKDERLTALAKRVLRHSVMYLKPSQSVAYAEYEGTSFMQGLPDIIRKREETGFKRSGVTIGKGREWEEEVWLHELAHAIDMNEGDKRGTGWLSGDPAFIRDAQKYMKEYEPEYPETPNEEWYAMLFARTVTGSRDVPSYIKKWFKPYIK
ncbi:MAG: hypothetical protein KAS61_11965, partial [Spirochaetes bacterium]|nr:hypothetical protein [Spirochaetota bacterium]